MSFINDQERKIPQLLKQAGVSRFVYFIYIVAFATVGGGFFVQSITPDIDWSDWGAVAIMSVAAGACYAMIWLYIKQIATHPKH